MWQSIQKNMEWRAVPVAGFAAGTVFLLSSVVLLPAVLEINVGLLLRYIAALLLGPDVLVEEGSGALVVGVILHYALSMVFALVVAVVVHRWGLAVGIIGGVLLGVSIYTINLYTVTALFDWFFAINNWTLLLSHALFGATAGGVYELFDHYDTEFKLEV